MKCQTRAAEARAKRLLCLALPCLFLVRYRLRFGRAVRVLRKTVGSLILKGELYVVTKRWLFLT